jgi:hypothetical protein
MCSSWQNKSAYCVTSQVMPMAKSSIMAEKGKWGYLKKINKIMA